MKKTLTQKVLAVLLAVALLSGLPTAALAENGPSPEHYEDFYYARAELVVLDGEGNPLLVDNGGWLEQKTLPLYADGMAVAQEGAAYDPATNTLTLTDFKGNYMLRANLMGDDFTLCVEGDCSLSSIVVYGGGEIQPEWGGSLRITGGGRLSVNGDMRQESGILFYPQSEETAQFTVDPQVTLSVSGSRTAVEAYGYYGEFSMKYGDETVEINKNPAVRSVYLYLNGFSNPWNENIRLCRNAADPEGIYDMSVWYQDEDMTVVSNVTVDRYVYIEKYDLYLIDHAWAREQSESGEVEFTTVQEANDAGFTFLYEDDGSDAWLTVNSMGNYGPENAYQDAEGNRYVVDNVYDEQGSHRVAMTAEPLEELPGEYLFLIAPDVDPDDLSEVCEETVIEDMYDYTYRNLILEYTPEEVIGEHEHDYVEELDKRVEPTCGTQGARFYRCSVCYEEISEPIPATGAHAWELTEEDKALGIQLYTCSVCGEEKIEVVEPEETEPEYPGDVDGDRYITAADARLALRASLKLETFSEEQTLAADYNRDGVVTPADARLILRSSISLSTDGSDVAGILPGEGAGVSFTVGEYDDDRGRAKVSAGLVNAVGLTSGKLNFSYADGTVTKLAFAPGADADNTARLGNAFCSELNSGINPSEYGFYFKEHLWATSVWDEQAAEREEDAEVNGEPFEFAVFTFTAPADTVITVTGELVIGEGTVEINDIIELRHSWDEGKITKEPTCTEAGEKLLTCTVCGETMTQRIDPPGHTVAEDAAVPPTCTEAGKTAGSHCSVCGETLCLPEIVPAAGHQWNDGTVSKEATCTEKGEMTFTCTVCGATEKKDVDVNGHTEAADAAVPPTCTEAGKTAGSHCSVCGAVLKAQETIPAVGHSFGAWKKLDEMRHQRVCANDGSHVETEGHTWDDGVVTKEAAFDEEGEMTFTCTVCGGTKIEPIPKTPVPSIDAETAKETDDGVFTVSGMKAKDLLLLAGTGATITKADGKDLTGTEAVGSGMTLTKPDGTRLTVIIKGDNDGDGKISSADARLALRRSVSLEKFTDWQTAASLVGGGETVSSADARLILRASVALETLPLT